MHYFMLPNQAITQPMIHDSTGKPDIFIIDDDATMRELMIYALEDGDYNIEEYSNGMDAMEAIAKNQPDMVLLDVKMPIMNGFDVCTKIRDNFGDINTSIVMVTGLDDSASIDKAFELGATAFISKPINWVTFPHVVRYHLKARNAFVELKNREIHLEHMDVISRIITQHMGRDIVLQESVNALLGIFNADSAAIISTTGVSRKSIEITCESTGKYNIYGSSNRQNLVSLLSDDILYRASGSEYPLIFSGEAKGDYSTGAETGIHSLIIKRLHSEDDRTWFLIVRKPSRIGHWSSHEQEIFYGVGIRLGGALSQYLLMERLHRSEQLLRQAQHIGHLGNWCWNVATGLLTWSEEMFLIYGYEPGSFTPEYARFFKVIFEEDNARLRKFEHTAFASGETFNIEHRIKLPTGETRWVHEQAVGLLDETGQLIEINGTVQDITERLKKQEQELHDNKMETIGQLTSGISHDFGNLMTIAKGNLDLLQEMLPDHCQGNTEYMEILNDASSAIKDGVELTKQLLSFSRKKATSPEAINFKHTLTGFKKLIKNTLGTKITLSTEIQNDLPDILVDPALFISSLINIIINARDAMPDGGELIISAKLHNSQRTEYISKTSTNNDENYLCISITDNGTGMDESVLQHAVEPFFTTKDEGGTGLGLSMAYALMKQSCGDLAIDSKPGKGTRVIMNFPVYGGAAISHTVETIDDTRLKRRATVLVVDDSHAVRQLVVRCLGKLGVNILESENAENAQVLLNENRDIDLLFTDILMPGNINGRDLANWATDNYPGLKVLVTTAAKKEALQLLHARDRPFQLLLKPYSTQDLTKKVLNMLKSSSLSSSTVP